MPQTWLNELCDNMREVCEFLDYLDSYDHQRATEAKVTFDSADYRYVVFYRSAP